MKTWQVVALGLAGPVVGLLGIIFWPEVKAALAFLVAAIILLLFVILFASMFHWRYTFPRRGRR